MTEQRRPYAWELLERIIGLERDNFSKKQLGQAQAELNVVKAELADIGKGFKLEVDRVTSGFKYVYQHIADIHDQLWPLVHKIFPGNAKTQRQISMIVRNGVDHRMIRNPAENAPPAPRGIFPRRCCNEC